MTAHCTSSASERRIPVRRRSDLVVSSSSEDGSAHWVVKHPLTLEYFHFREEEFALLQMLNGQVSLAELKARFAERFFPHRISTPGLEQFLGSLYEAGLIDSVAPTQGERLLELAERRTRQKKLALLSPLSVRLPPLNCGRVLRLLDPLSRPIFSKLGFVAWCLLVTTAVLLVTINFEAFTIKLPRFAQFFGAANWHWLFVALVGAKLAHEFGHALACRRFGARCEHIGVILLAFIPCLYCDVSDSCMIPARWKRALIAAAGMYVEMGLAALATFVWWLSEDGMASQLALALMLTCSVSTLMFNLNPLMKMDGYYILADCVGEHNLAEKSGTVLQDAIALLILGWSPDRPLIPKRERSWLAVYGVMSLLYRLFVMTVILLFVYGIMEENNLEIIGQAVVTTVVITWIGWPTSKLIKFLLIPGVQRKVRTRNLIAAAFVLPLLVSAICWIPLPRSVQCEFEVQPGAAATIYASTSGRLQSIHVHPGQQVEAGQLLAELSNEELLLSRTELQSRLAEIQAQLESHHKQRFEDPEVLGEIPRLEKTIIGLQHQIERKKEEVAKLRLIAPIAGTVMQVPSRPPVSTDHESLEQWSGSLLEGKNLGAAIQAGERFCLVGDPDNYQAMLVVDQADISLIQPGLPVQLKVRAFPDQTWVGKVSDISRVDLKHTPVNLSTSAGGKLASYESESGMLRPLRTTYSVLVPMNVEDTPLKTAMRGEARIALGEESLGSRAYKALLNLLYFRN